MSRNVLVLCSYSFGFKGNIFSPFVFTGNLLCNFGRGEVQAFLKGCGIHFFCDAEQREKGVID